MSRLLTAAGLITLTVLLCATRAPAQSPAAPAAPAQIDMPGSVVLSEITWPQAERRLTRDAVVLWAYGNASKAHGAHLPLATDFLQAEYVKTEVAKRTPVLVAPSIPYGYYPPFLEYPGSTTVPLSVTVELIASVCRSYARTSQVRRCYMVAHGPITRAVVAAVTRELAAEGLLFRGTDWDAAKAAGVAAVKQQTRGSHADEIETSMLLAIAPGAVDMRQAVREYGASPETGGRMIGNRPERDGVLSPSGVFGDATLATADKGRRIVDGVIDAVVRDVQALRAAPLPPQPDPDAGYRAVAGDYEVTPGDLIVVGRDGDLLTVQRGRQPAIRLQPGGPFRYGLWTTEARFLRDAAGAVTHLQLSTNGRDVVARRRAEGAAR